MEIREVVLYYPNEWRSATKNISDSEDRKFNWFLCSKRYKDPLSGFYVAEVSKLNRFYDERTGHTLVISPLIKIDVKLLILDDFERDHEKNASDTFEGRRFIKILKKYGYQGYVYTSKCVSLKDACKESCNDDFLCKEVRFGFFEGILEKSQKENSCGVIEYSKRNYKCISKIMSDFPTPEDIDDALLTYKCNLVCKVLYEYISDYFHRKLE